MNRTASNTARQIWPWRFVGGTALLALGILGCASASGGPAAANAGGDSPPTAPMGPTLQSGGSSSQASIGSGSAPASASAPAARNHHEIAADADAAYKAKEYPRCASLYDQAAAQAPGNAGAMHLYNAACCYALAGDKDRAFTALDQSLRLDLFNPSALDADNDFASLRGDPRWTALREKESAARARHRASLHPELYRIYEEDQKDRAPGPNGIDWKVVTPRDEARRKRVLELIAKGELKHSDDYYHASMIFQHGSSLEDIEKAHELALEAAKIDPKNERAKWLAAATKDRALMKQDKPQLYGTQYRKVDGVWIQHPVDPSITDEERARWNVSPLRQSQRYVEQLNKKN